MNFKMLGLLILLFLQATAARVLVPGELEEGKLKRTCLKRAERKLSLILSGDHQQKNKYRRTAITQKNNIHITRVRRGGSSCQNYFCLS